MNHFSGRPVNRIFEKPVQVFDVLSDPRLEAVLLEKKIGQRFDARNHANVKRIAIDNVSGLAESTSCRGMCWRRHIYSLQVCQPTLKSITVNSEEAVASSASILVTPLLRY